MYRPISISSFYFENSNSTAAPMPGVDVMQGFQLSKKEFENVFLQAAERAEADKTRDLENQPTLNQVPRPARLPLIGRKQSSKQDLFKGNGSRHPRAARDHVLQSINSDRASARPPTGDRDLTHRNMNTLNSFAGYRKQGSVPYDLSRVHVPGFPVDQPVETPQDAERYADACRRMAASLQKSTPPDYEGAGELFEKAVDARTRFGMYCSTSNADAHVEYAQNLSKRGLTPEAEYHLRTAADVFRVLDAKYARKYGDVLLYIAVVIDRQGRLAEAENFYRSALGIYRANKLSDDNVRVAIDSLSNNLRAQGRAEEVDTVIQRHFLGC